MMFSLNFFLLLQKYIKWYILYIDVPFHMADKKEKAKGDVSMGLGNDKDGDVIMGLGKDKDGDVIIMGLGDDKDGDVIMGLEDDKDGSILYLNFSNDDPVVSDMKKGIDTFDEEISVPVLISKNNQYGSGTIGVTFDNKYDIGWRGANGDHHVIKTYPDESWMVDSKSVSVEPKFDVAKPAKSMREHMLEKLKAKVSDIDEHKPGSMDRSITD